jgi:PAS domain-containing protein
MDRQPENRLVDVLRETLKACDGLLHDLNAALHEHAQSAQRFQSSEEDWNRFFDRIPSACVCTDVHGFILKANPAAADLLSISVRHLDTRLLTHFVEDRDQFIRALRGVVWEGIEYDGVLTIRPRDRAPLTVDIRAVRRTADDNNVVLWFLQPSGMTPLRTVGARGRRGARVVDDVPASWPD